MDLEIVGKLVVITRGSNGIGAAAARPCAHESCRAICVARRKARLEQIVTELRGAQAGYERMAIDLLGLNEATTATHSLANQFGSFDIVLHNLGRALGIKEPLAGVEQWQRAWNFNVGILIAISNLLIPFMRQNAWGRVIHRSSISGKIGEPRLSPFGGSLPYAAARAYLNAYVQRLGRELAEHNIVICAMPAAVLSGGKYWDKVSKQNSELARTFLERHHSIRRFGKPEEIDSFATLMASQHAFFAYGALVPIVGGRV